MRVNNILIFGISIFIFQGCYLGTSNYEIFKTQNDGIVERKTSFQYHPTIISPYYDRKDYDKNFYIYIRNDKKRNISKKCIYGFIVKKDDKRLKAVDWKIISGKEYCKQQQKYMLSF